MTSAFLDLKGALSVEDIDEIANVLLVRDNHPGLHTLGAMLNEGEARLSESRRDEALALAVYLLSTRAPAEEEEGVRATLDITKMQYALTLRCIRAVSPRALVRWASHMDMSPATGRVDHVYVSEYLASILKTIEEIFAVPQWIIVDVPPTTITSQ
jgi:hypothetical protein